MIKKVKIWCHSLWHPTWLLLCLTFWRCILIFGSKQTISYHTFISSYFCIKTEDDERQNLSFVTKWEACTPYFIVIGPEKHSMLKGSTSRSTCPHTPGFYCLYIMPCVHWLLIEWWTVTILYLYMSFNLYHSTNVGIIKAIFLFTLLRFEW